MTPAARFRAMLAEGALIQAPGVFDGLSARLVEQAGFRAAYASGGAISRGAGMPDLGLLSVGEIVERMAQIADAVEIPVIADADTGYGNALNARRAARQFARAGVAAIHLEDQTFPKKCGHYDDKSIIETDAFARKLDAVKDAVGDDLVLIARTDALAVAGFDEAIARCRAYADAGADLVFLEAPRTVAQIEKAARLVTAPLLLNIFAGGKTPMVPLRRLQELGVAVVIVPSDLQRAAIFAMQETLRVIAEDGDSSRLADRMATFADRERIVGAERWNELNRRFAE